MESPYRLSISATRSSPQMNMLNRLYLLFDQLLLKHGLFKVETIGGELSSCQ